MYVYFLRFEISSTHIFCLIFQKIPSEGSVFRFFIFFARRFGVIGAFHAGVRIDRQGVAFIVASILGMLVGRRLCAHVPARALQVGFASVCGVVALYMLVKAQA